MWQRLGNRKISWDVAILAKVMRNRGRFFVAVSSGEPLVVDICLMLIVSKPRLTSPSEMSSAGVLIGRWNITALIGFKDLG